MYADDTSLAYSAKSVSDISNVMNNELESFRTWLSGNKPSLNVAKTTSMLIGTRNTLQDKDNGELFRQSIQSDNQLKWKEHVVSVSMKVSHAIGMIRYAKKILPQER